MGSKFIPQSGKSNNNFLSNVSKSNNDTKTVSKNNKKINKKVHVTKRNG